MQDVRVVIVDDSVFSIAVIREILESNGIKVVGDAGTLEEVKQVVSEKKPTLVTMDMTLPGTDGFECTRAIHEIDPSVKVIVVSSMMDDEIVKTAKKTRVSAYIQKPIDGDELITTVRRVTETEELFKFLKAEYVAAYKEALLDTVNRMTKTLLTYKDTYTQRKEHVSAGVTVIIGIIGMFSGRMLIDLSKEAANNLTAAMLRRETKSNDEMTAALREFTNIVAGNACSILNRKNKALGLRVAPPSILSGENVMISAPDFATTTALAVTEYGEMTINVGFQEGEDRWM